MTTGDIILLPFPFAEQTGRKVRPAVVVCETRDAYRDLVVCAISSVLPSAFGATEIALRPSPENGLRVASVLKVDRIVTANAGLVLARLGRLSNADQALFREKFRTLVG